MDNIELQGIVISHSDTIADFAMQIQWKIMQSVKDTGVPVGLSAARGWNPFPWVYREDAIRHYNSEALQAIKDNPDWPPYPSGDSLLSDLLTKAVENDNPVTLLITSPITPLSDLLTEHPELEEGIARLVWMGGAIQEDGNLDSNTIPTEVANPQVEWNVYWDPHGADWIFRNTSFPIILFPLDVTNEARLTEEFMQNLKQQASSYEYSKLVYQGYLLVIDDPTYEMWNSLTTIYLDHPEFFEEPKTMHLKIEVDGYSQGEINQNPDGRQVVVVFNIAQSEEFYTYVLDQLQKNFAHESQ